MQEGLQSRLFVALCPGSDWQLCNFNGVIVNDGNLAVDNIAVRLNLFDCSLEVLVGRDLCMTGRSEFHFIS